MKNPIQNLNRAFENKVRLGVMAALMVNSRLSFNELKDLLELTDGNLASHIKALEKEKFISVNKTFVGKKPNTTYAVTSSGSKAFELHLKSLEDLINNQNNTNK